jgi:hypothetical protein
VIIDADLTRPNDSQRLFSLTHRLSIVLDRNTYHGHFRRADHVRNQQEWKWAALKLFFMHPGIPQERYGY